MQDTFGRDINYLRVSITDRCNLRCIYCMPQDGVTWLPHKEMMTFEETLRICTVAADLGINRIKVTGGEPLVRRGVTGFVRALKKITGIKKVSMTTNALVLDQYLQELICSGLDAINISLDTLDESTFKRITRCADFSTILKTIKAVVNTPLNVKINCVPIKGINENDIVPLAELACENNIAVRFIELMPLGYGASMQAISQKEIMDLLENKFGALTLSNKEMGGGPAVYYDAPGFKGKIGFISSLTHIFCTTCNRLRLTSTGLLKPCLSSGISIDIKKIIRSNGSDTDIADAINMAIKQKPLHHTFAQHNNEALMFKLGG